MGQLSHKTALYLARHGMGTFMCSAGIGAHHQGITAFAQGCDRIIVIEGGGLACAKEPWNMLISLYTHILYLLILV